MNERPTILLVEDDPGARKLFEEAIDETKISELVVASDGAEALEYLPHRDGNAKRPPDLVILDLDLPEIHGIEVLREFRAENSLARRTPILVISHVSDPAVIDEVYELGASAFLPKPDDYDDLRELVREIEEFWLGRVWHPPNRGLPDRGSADDD